MTLKKYHYIYITTNIINEKQYIGDRSCNCLPENDKSYIGSGRPAFNNAVKKYGKKNFKKEILEILESRKETHKAEEKYIKLYKTHISEDGYNISWAGGHGRINDTLSVAIKEKISKSLKGRKFSKERRKNISDGLKNISEKLSENRKGLKLSEETKRKISLKQKGKKLSNETRKKMSESKKGKPNYKLRGKSPWNKDIPMEEDAKAKMIRNSTGVSRNKGGKLSEETKEKLRKSNLGKKQSKETIEKRMKTMGDVWNKGLKTK